MASLKLAPRCIPMNQKKKGASSSETNKWIGFWGLDLIAQDEFLKECFGKELFSDPAGRYLIISNSGTSMGTVLNPLHSSGTLLYFGDSKSAVRYAIARREWFEGKNIAVSDACIGKFCPIGNCSCASKD